MKLIINSLTAFSASERYASHCSSTLNQHDELVRCFFSLSRALPSNKEPKRSVSVIQLISIENSFFTSHAACHMHCHFSIGCNHNSSWKCIDRTFHVCLANVSKYPSETTNVYLKIHFGEKEKRKQICASCILYLLINKKQKRKRRKKIIFWQNENGKNDKITKCF